MPGETALGAATQALPPPAPVTAVRHRAQAAGHRPRWACSRTDTKRGGIVAVAAAAGVEGGAVAVGLVGRAAGGVSAPCGAVAKDTL